MSFLLSPVIALMQRLRLFPKFLIVALIFALPALLVSGLLIAELNKSISFSEQERVGVLHVRQVQELLRLTQQHRALRHLALAGNAAAQQQALKTQQELNAKLALFDNVQQAHPALGITAAFGKSQQAWQALLQTLPSAKAKDSYAAHSALIDQWYKLSTQIADRSTLSLDPKVDTYYLINIFTKTFPELANQIADIAARGAPYIDTGVLEPNEDVLINANVMLASRDISRMSAQLESMLRDNPGIKSSLAAQQSVVVQNLAFLERARNEVMNALNQTSGTEFLGAGQKSVDGWYAYANAAASLLDASLQERIASDVLKRNVILAAIAGMLLLATYLLSGFYVAFSRDVKKLHDAVECVTQGDLSQSMQSQGKDEIARLLTAFDGMRQVLARLVADIRHGTESITTASSEIAHGNADLSSRTEQQASSLEETSAAMEELTTTVRQNAQSAQQANKNALAATAIANAGGTAVTELIGMMDGIQHSSKKISDIIGVIDSIAFQTNILALNAAVEAARAGEQGRGFAVVATEVRNLAQRSASAAREIKTLITTSVEQVAAGGRQVQSAGQTMEQIVVSIHAVTGNMHDISVASAGQRTGIEQVNATLGQLDDITQQNSALVEQAAAAAESMHDQAIRLTQAVAVFTITPAHAASAATSHGNRALRVVPSQHASANSAVIRKLKKRA
ncbi:hypothetical protein BH11PSE12_BH11PSE12_23910 [soil metagenome]